MQNTVRNTALVIRSVVDTYVAITVYGIAAGHESGALVAGTARLCRNDKRHTNATNATNKQCRRAPEQQAELETSLLLRNRRPAARSVMSALKFEVKKDVIAKRAVPCFQIRTNHSRFSLELDDPDKSDCPAAHKNSDASHV